MKATYIDPPSPAYYGNRLFEIGNAVLNRDDSLLPYAQVRDALKELQVEVHTADLIPNRHVPGGFEYYSLGILENFRALSSREDACMRAFVIFEPPVVEPRLYKSLPELTQIFEEVYLHNVHGDGYSLKGVNTERLRKLYWPQPRQDVIEEYWGNRNRAQRIVVINGNHIPQRVANELYSKRIEAMSALAPSGRIDLYGRGWDRWWSRASMWRPYWQNRSMLMSIYHGACESKYEVLSKYQFSLCIENMAMQGYVTEKIFDCFYAGAIPLYLGAPDIQELVPEDSYVDCRNFPSWSKLLSALDELKSDDLEKMRQSGREFIQGRKSSQYRESLLRVFRATPGAQHENR